MGSNRVTLAQLKDLTVKQVSELPIDQINVLLEDVKELKSQYDSYAKKLDAALDERFSAQADAARAVIQKQTGTARFAEGDYTIIADLPKKITWEQAALRALFEQLQEGGDDPLEYIEQKLSVPERSYDAWPSPLKKMFEPARTLGTGKPTYKLERIKDNG